MGHLAKACAAALLALRAALGVAAAAYPERTITTPDEAGQTPEAPAELVRTEIDKWVPIIKKAGVTGN